MELAVVIVPIQINAEIPFTMPVVGAIIMLLENSHNVVNMLFANILDANVVKAEREAERTPFVYPKTWSDLTLPTTPLV